MNERAPNELNPFGKGRDQTAQPMQQVASDRAQQEVQAGMVIAKKFPRDKVACMDKILTACARTSVAEQAMYEYPKGGTIVTGPSIRLAEIVLQNWDNLWCGVVELSRTAQESVAEAYCWDLESNARDARIFTVPHLRHTKQGAYPIEDPREIYELVANQGARRKRAAIQAVVPNDVFDAAIRQCEVTLKAEIDTSTEAVQKMVGAFESHYGVTTDQIVKMLGHRLDNVSPGEMIRLRKIWQSLKDGFAAPEQFFGPSETPPEGGGGSEPRGAQPGRGVDGFKAAAQAARGGNSEAPQARGPSEQLREQANEGGGTASRESQPAQRPAPGTKDSQGVPYDDRIHAGNGSQNKDGTWRRRRGLQDEQYNRILREIMGPEQEPEAAGDDSLEQQERDLEGFGAPEAPAEPPQDATGDGSPEPPPWEGESENPAPVQQQEAPQASAGQSDSQLVNQILASVKRARQDGDVELVYDLADLVRDIQNDDWRAEADKQVNALAEEMGIDLT